MSYTAGSGPVVGDFGWCSAVDSSVFGGEEWFSSVLVCGVGSVGFDPVCEGGGGFFGECDGSFPIGFVFEWGVGFWSVSDLEVLLAGVEVGGVEGSDCASAHHGVPHEEEGDVWS